MAGKAVPLALGGCYCLVVGSMGCEETLGVLTPSPHQYLELAVES